MDATNAFSLRYVGETIAIMKEVGKNTVYGQMIQNGIFNV